jgi:hypothetical protein
LGMPEQHTKGPWRKASGAIDYGAVVSDTSPRPLTGHCLEADEVAAYGGYLIAESIAPQNKALIAAAPDLYEACAAVFSTVEYIHLPDDVIRVLRNAMAKAEGRGF